LTIPFDHLSTTSPLIACSFHRRTLEIIHCSDALALAAGYRDASELRDSYVIDLFGFQSLEAFEDLLRSENFDKTAQCKMANHKHGDHSMVVSVIPTSKTPDDDILLLLCMPVPDYVSDIAVLQEKNDQLEAHNQRLTELSSLLGHNLRGALHGILGHVQAVSTSEDPATESPQQSILRQIQQIGTGMNRVLTDVTRLIHFGEQVAPMEFTDLNLVVDKLIDELKHFKGQEHTIRRVSNLPKVMCQAQLVQELLRNLLENGIYYAGDQSAKIEIGTREAELPTFYVKDNGVGIHPEDISKVVRPLHRADRDQLNQQGTGLGLTLCQSIIERHGGKLCMESERGVGTTVWFTLSKHGG